MQSNRIPTVLITGGAGFIGSHVVRKFIKSNQYAVVNLDKLTYAGNLSNLQDIKKHPSYTFVKGDICDHNLVKQLFNQYHFSGVVHLAAESHVDRSITDPTAFVHTNVLGTANLLNAVREHKNKDIFKCFYHVSTDEVYGSLGSSGFFTEKTPYDPQSPYSASKASSDHIVRAYGNTYGIPYIISNCSNNYGPNQFPEKLIPLMILNISKKLPLPIYGQGENVRDWLYVEDHASAILLLFQKGKSNETYTIGGFNEWKNIDLVKLLCNIIDQKLDQPVGTSQKLITYVTDRAGHDLRYAIDASKIKNELGWQPSLDFEEGIRKTIDWYLNHKDWLNDILSGNYL